MKTTLSAFLIFCSVLVFGQTNHNHEHETTKQSVLNSYFASLSKNEYGIDNATWNSYTQKTYLLLEEAAVDRASFLNYVFLTGDGNFNDIQYFLEYYKAEFAKEESELIYKVGKGELNNNNVKKYFTGLQPKWMNELKAFNLKREEIIANSSNLRGGSAPNNPTPLACGQPCTNPGFESGMTFWEYSTGTADQNFLLPQNIVPGLNATKPQHFIKSAGGYDAVCLGTNLPQVAPNGGNFSLMLGDSSQVMYGAALASISFDVTPASQSFNFSYALVLQDAAGHTANARPYFRVRMYDQNNNLIQCGEFEIIAQPPYAGFTQVTPTSTWYYKPWVSNTISLANYVGQCIKLEFITKDCGLGGHAGYAYIDADCSSQNLNNTTISTCSFPYSISAPAGFVSYAWTNLAGGTTGIIGSDTLQTIQVGQPGTYQCVLVTPAGPTCIILATYVITGGGAPTAAYTNTTVCVGTATQFTDASTAQSSANPITNWYWDFNGDGTIDDSTQNPSYTYPAAGQYQVTLIVSANGCNDTITQTVTVHPVANINAGPDQTICETSTVTLAAIFGGAATAGTWSGGTGTYNPGNTAPNAVYTPSAAEIAAGQVTLTFTTNAPSGPCVTNVDQMTIFIQHLPTANAGSPQSICEGKSVTLNGSIGGGATAATWSGGNGTFTPNNTTLNATYTPTAAEFAAGSVTLTLTTNNPGGLCPPATSTVVLNLYPNPVVNFTVDIPKGCPIHCVQFTDQSTVIGNNTINAWSWTLGDGTTSNVQNPAHCYSNTGFYDVSLTVTTNNGCTGTLTIPQMIEVFAIPKADFTPTPNPASSFNPTVFFINQSSSDVVSWEWDFGDGNTHPDNVTPNPSHLYPGIMDTSYMITLIVENADGCKDTTQKPLIVGPEFTFFIPNCFTPNGDGINDGFNGTGIGIVEYDIWIFDRWGDMIWHSDKYAPLDYWDGRANQGSDVAQQDVYVWKVKLKDIFGKYHKYIGTVTLVK